jgi:hypothetical protein
MNALGVISEAVNYSAQLLIHLDKLVILAFLSVVPVANILVLGYLARVIQATPISGGLPLLDRWGAMFVDGIRVLLISLVYLLAGILVIILTFYAGSGALVLVGLLVLFGGFLLLPLALVHGVRTGNPGSALALGTMITKVMAIGPFDYLILVVAMFVLPAAFLAVALYVPLLGPLVALLASPAMGIFVARAAALAYG